MANGSEQEFDASIGLAFSLRAFEKYRKSGILSAEVRGIPGMRGQSLAYLELVEGKIVSCYVIDRNGERLLPGKELLMRLDEERGPFKWVFRAASFEQMSPVSSAGSKLHELKSPYTVRSPIFRPLVPYLETQSLQRWTPQQQQHLCAIFTMINGQATLDEIKARLALPSHIVEDNIRILLQLKVIAL